MPPLENNGCTCVYTVNVERVLFASDFVHKTTETLQCVLETTRRIDNRMERWRTVYVFYCLVSRGNLFVMNDVQRALLREQTETARENSENQKEVCRESKISRDKTGKRTRSCTLIVGTGFFRPREINDHYDITTIYAIIGFSSFFFVMPLIFKEFNEIFFSFKNDKHPIF